MRDGKVLKYFQKSFYWKNYYKFKSVPMLEISQSYILSLYGQQNFQPWYKTMHRQAGNCNFSKIGLEQLNNQIVHKADHECSIQKEF